MGGYDNRISLSRSICNKIHRLFASRLSHQPPYADKLFPGKNWIRSHNIQFCMVNKIVTDTQIIKVVFLSL